MTEPVCISEKSFAIYDFVLGALTQEQKRLTPGKMFSSKFNESLVEQQNFAFM